MKNFIAKIMVAIMVITAVMPSISAVLLYANTSDIQPLNPGGAFGIEATFDQSSLTTGGPNHTPSPVQTSVPAGSVRLNMGLGGIQNESISFSYLIEANKKVEFNVSRNPGSTRYRAEYSVSNFVSGTWVPVDPNTVLVYSATTNTFITGQEFANLPEAVRPNHNVEITSDSVIFEFEQNNGFSFMFDGRTVHFVHESANNRIIFTTDGLSQDIVYNFYRQSSLGTVTERAFVGVNINNFGFIPFSSDRTSGINNNLNINYQNVDQILDYNAEEFPAQQDVGIAIRFEEPMDLWLNGTTPNFTPISQNVSANYVMPVRIMMGDNRTSGNPSMTITIPNILDLEYVTDLEAGPSNPDSVIINTPAIMPTDPSPDSWAGIIYNPADPNLPNRIEVRLKGLIPGTIFTNGEIDTLNFTASGRDVVLRGGRGVSTIPLGRIFTFPEYTFIYRDGSFHIEVTTPFYDFSNELSGVYILRNQFGVELHRQIFNRGEPIIMPIPAVVGQLGTYQVVFAPNANTDTNINMIPHLIYSEISSYDPDPASMDIGTPRSFEIVSYDLKPLDIYNPPENWGNEGLLSMTLKWNVGAAQNIRAMINASPDGYVEVNYAANKALRPEANLGATFAYINMQISEVAQGFQADYTATSPEGDIIAQGQTLLTQSAQGFLYMEIELTDITATRAQGPAVESENNDPTFLFPRIYHINLETVIASEDGETRLPSLFQSITLDDLIRPQVPPVQNLNIVSGSVTDSAFSLSWHVPGREVLEFMRRSSYEQSTLGNELGFSVNLYISQNEPLMRDLANLQNLEQRRDFASNFPADTLMQDGDLVFSGAPLLALRNDNVVLIENIDIGNYIQHILGGQNFPVSLDIEGLDENQRYYVYVTLVSTYEVGTLIDEQESMVSELLALTTIGEPSIPGPENRVPAPPDVSIKDVGLDTATVYWPYVELHPAESPISVHYEVVRIRNEQMDDRLLNSSADIYDFIDIINSQMPNAETVFLRTPPNEQAGELEVFRGSNFVPADEAEFALTFGPTEIEIVDNTLASNQIYFYYVRTVRTVNGVVSHSQWAVDTATTSTLSPPINLEIDLTRDDYDPKTEFAIRFDAPILNLSLLGPEIVFNYSIREEDGEFSDPVRMNSQTLLNSASESSEADHTSFTYKISGLRPNTGYTIRVNMHNLRTGDTSSWSNTATTRTEVDQDIADEERDLGVWLDYYKQELERLMRNPYWILQDTRTEFRVVYRPSMFDSLLVDSTGGQILLAQSSQDANTYIYYIPSSILLEANKQGRGFTIRMGDIDVIIPPNALNPIYNEQLMAINNDIRNTNNNIVDYYLRITARKTQFAGSVQGNQPLTDQIQINFEVVGSDQTAESWDLEILEMYVREIDEESRSDEVRDWLLRNIRRGRPSEEIIRGLLDFVDEKRTYLIRRTNTSFNRTRTRSGNRTINELNASMIIVYRNNEQGVVVNGYRWNGGWHHLEASNFGEFRGIRSNIPGTFIFAGRRVSVPGLTDTPNASVAFAIITKYSLDEVLGENGAIDLDTVATRHMFIESVARIGGAPRGSDPVQFLRSKGYFVPAGNLQQPITKQEAIYLMMSVYEIRTGTRVETIVIRNHSATANIQGIDQRYLQSVRAAFEIGLYTNTNMQPNGSITVREMLQMLTLLDAKVSL